MSERVHVDVRFPQKQRMLMLEHIRDENIKLDNETLLHLSRMTNSIFASLILINIHAGIALPTILNSVYEFTKMSSSGVKLLNNIRTRNNIFNQYELDKLYKNIFLNSNPDQPFISLEKTGNPN